MTHCLLNQKSFNVKSILVFVSSFCFGDLSMSEPQTKMQMRGSKGEFLQERNKKEHPGKSLDANVRRQ